MKALISITLLLILISACSGTEEVSPTPTVEPLATASPAPYPVEPVTFTTADGIDLAGTLFGEGDVAVILAHQGTVGTDQTSWHPFARLLAEREYAALAFDFRGVGQSGGDVLYGSLATDIAAAAQFLDDVGYQQIVCIGASMGGTACIRAAQDRAFAGLVILASTTMAGGGSDYLRLTSDNLEGLAPPKLFIAAEGDRQIVVDDTEQMYNLSPYPKELVLLPGSQHGTDLFDTDVGEALSSALQGFLDDVRNPPSEELPALQPISVENAADIQLLRTMVIPDYRRGAISQCGAAFSPDGRWLVGACGDNQVPVWDVQTGTLVQSLYDAPVHIVTCDFSPDGTRLACGGFDRVITLWDTTTWESIGSFEGHSGNIWDIDFDPTGESLVACSLDLRGQADIRLWSMLQETLWVYSGGDWFLSVSFHPSGETAAYGSVAGTVGILDVESGTLLRELADSRAFPTGGIAYSASGRWLAAGNDDDRVYLWDASEYEMVAGLEAHTGYVNGVAFSPDETLLVSGSHDKTVGVWDVANLELITLLQGHDREVLRPTFSPDGTMIASTSWDGTVLLWGVPQ